MIAILKRVDFQYLNYDIVFWDMSLCQKSDIWFSELNHIYNEDVINVAPNDSNWGAHPIRSLQEEQSKLSFLDNLTFSLAGGPFSFAT